MTPATTGSLFGNYPDTRRQEFPSTRPTPYLANNCPSEPTPSQACCLQTRAPASAGGEVDLRGCYTALAIAHMLRLDTHLLARHCALPDFLQQCQVQLWQHAGHSIMLAGQAFPRLHAVSVWADKAPRYFDARLALTACSDFVMPIARLDMCDCMD